MTRFLLSGALVATGIYGLRPEALHADDRRPYRLAILSTPDGAPDSRGHSINNLGWVSGYVNAVGNVSREATLWVWGFRIPLGTLGGPNSAIVWPVKNDNGLLVGIAQTSRDDPNDEAWSCSGFFPGSNASGPECRGIAWDWGYKRELRTLGGTHSYAAGANNRRQIVGWAENTVLDNTCIRAQKLQFHAVVWGPGKDEIRDLGTYGTDSSSAATAINDRGQVVGISGRCDTSIGRLTAQRAILWDRGVPQDIGNLGGLGWNTPAAINERGEVVGFAGSPGDDLDNPRLRAFYWSRRTGIKEIMPLPGHTNARGWGINKWGIAVGTSCPAAGRCSAIAWKDGVTYDLNKIVDLDETAHALDSAQDINDLGQITGRVVTLATGARAPYIATPKWNR